MVVGWPLPVVVIEHFSTWLLARQISVSAKTSEISVSKSRNLDFTKCGKSEVFRLTCGSGRVLTAGG